MDKSLVISFRDLMALVINDLKNNPQKATSDMLIAISNCIERLERRGIGR